MMTTLYLIRHAQQNWDRVTPDEKWPLTLLGREQAQSLVLRLKKLNPDSLWCSDTERATQTFRPFARSEGLVLNRHKDLRERPLTWPPPPLDEMKEHYRRGWEDFDYVLPKGESNKQAQIRFMRGLDMIALREGQSKVAVCAHGNVIALAVHATLGEWTDESLDYCGGRTLEFNGKSWSYAGDLPF